MRRACAALAVALAILASSPAVQAGPLSDHRPVLRYDSRERDFATSVNGRGHVAYGRERKGSDGRR